MKSVNNKLILEPYEGSHKIESNTSSGFATIKQKTTLIGLKVLEDAQFVLPTKEIVNIEKKSTVFFEEEVLYSSAWAKKTYECDGIESRFIIADYSQVVMVDENNSKKVK